MKLISWNVNGIRACYKKGFVEFVEREDPDILAVQETKADPSQCEPPLVRAAGRVSFWSSAQKKGYSGTATFVKPGALEPKSVRHGIGTGDAGGDSDEFDREGRFVITEHEAFTLYNIYFVNGGSGPERHDFKQRFLKALYAHLAPLVKKGAPIIVTGDYNIAHTEADIHDPVGLAGESGFLPEERRWLDEFFKLGFVDTFRHLHPDVRDRYTWWSMYERGRVGNRGWRIDYFSVTKNLEKKLTGAQILDGQMGSDHCPIVVEIDV